MNRLKGQRSRPLTLLRVCCYVPSQKESSVDISCTPGLVGLYAKLQLYITNCLCFLFPLLNTMCWSCFYRADLLCISPAHFEIWSSIVRQIIMIRAPCILLYVCNVKFLNFKGSMMLQNWQAYNWAALLHCGLHNFQDCLRPFLQVPCYELYRETVSNDVLTDANTKVTNVKPFKCERTNVHTD
jgi:hypothetical protein